MRQAYACTRVRHNGTRDAFMRIIRYGRDRTRAESSSAAPRIADVRITTRPSRIREPETADVSYSWADYEVTRFERAAEHCIFYLIILPR